MRLGEAHQMQVDAIPTGSLSLDLALGVGGIPRGRITEIFGPNLRVRHHLPAYCGGMSKTGWHSRLH